jgi:hypothetical protein
MLNKTIFRSLVRPSTLLIRCLSYMYPDEKEGARDAYHVRLALVEGSCLFRQLPIDAKNTVMCYNPCKGDKRATAETRIDSVVLFFSKVL